MTSRYECKLATGALKKAVEELNEPTDNNKRLQAIDRLRNRFLSEENNLQLLRSDDAFILRFLRVRKFDEDRALETLKNYHVKRKEIPEVFNLVDNPKRLEDFINAGPLLPLKHGRAKNGTFVIIGKLGRGYTDGGDVMKFLALAVLTLEKLLENEEMQVYGVTIINDASEFPLSYLPNMATYSKTMAGIMQEAMPVRIKSVNLVNESKVIDLLYAIVTQFMKEKLKNRLQLHGSNYKTIHEKVDPCYLPFSLGGSGPDLDGNWWARQLTSSLGEGEDTAL